MPLSFIAVKKWFLFFSRRCIFGLPLPFIVVKNVNSMPFIGYCFLDFAFWSGSMSSCYFVYLIRLCLLLLENKVLFLSVFQNPRFHILGFVSQFGFFRCFLLALWIKRYFSVLDQVFLEGGMCILPRFFFVFSFYVSATVWLRFFVSFMVLYFCCSVLWLFFMSFLWLSCLCIVLLVLMLLQVAIIHLLFGGNNLSLTRCRLTYP